MLERPTPGLCEMLLRESMKVEPLAALSRAAAGTRGRTLIVNLPVRLPRGSRRSAAYWAAALLFVRLCAASRPS